MITPHIKIIGVAALLLSLTGLPLIQAQESENLAPIVSNPVSDMGVTSGTSLSIDLNAVFIDPDVERAISINTVFGRIYSALYLTEMPVTVSNFLGYVEQTQPSGGGYTGQGASGTGETFFHRSPGIGFVIQAGSYYVESNGSLGTINTDAPIVLESSASSPRNKRGTLAMARTASPDSATSGFYINTSDNSALDYVDPTSPGYAVFGRVLGNGMEIVDKIDELPTGDFGSPFNDLPVNDINGNSALDLPEDLVTISDISSINPLSFSISVGDPTLVSYIIQEDGNVRFDFAPGRSGSTSVTLIATDLEGASTQQSFLLNVEDADTDNDGIPNTEDPDDDNDGLSDVREAEIGTDPLKADTDMDGFDDAVERRTTRTDPLVNEFAGIPGIDYTSGAVRGAYRGLVTDGGGLPLGHLQITLASDGSYSGKLRGIDGYEWPFTGVMNDDATAIKTGYNAYGQEAQLVFSLWKPAKKYRVAGRFLAAEQGQPDQYFVLRRKLYGPNRLAPRLVRGRHTLHMPATTTAVATIPAGDGIGWGVVSKEGLYKLRGRSNSGKGFSYSSPVLEGNQVPFFARPNPKQGLEGLAGDLRFRNLDTSDIAGKVRYIRVATDGGRYADGFDQELALLGSKYRRPESGQLPLEGYALAPENALASFTGGYFDGSSHALTWDADGNMVGPEASDYTSSALFNNKVGLFQGSMIYSDPTSGDITTSLRGVVIQKAGIVTGQAVTQGGASGQYSITPVAP